MKNMESYIGVLIRKERLKRNVSQEGLCRGICVVSYLSKIEQGQVQAGEEIIKGLLKRLGIFWIADEAFLNEAEREIDVLYEKLYERALQPEDIEELTANSNRLMSSACMLDIMLFREVLRLGKEELNEYLSCMNRRQYELYLYWDGVQNDGSLEKLLKLNPNAFYLTEAGVKKWKQGNYLESVELLTRAYAVSSEEGSIQNMLQSKLILGNCYSSMNHQDLMMKNYMTAKRIAQAIGQEGSVEDIYYNIASTLLEWDRTQEAEVYFLKCSRYDVLYYHKYAICMEELGELDKAKKALEQGKELMVTEQAQKTRIMYEVVEYRLTHPDYLREGAYEHLLRACMQKLGEDWHRGFVQFHRKYLIEILKVQRKYKEIYQWMKDNSNSDSVK